MRNWRLKGLFVLLLALGLVFSTVSLLPAARNATSTCLTQCNTDNKPLKNACRDSMLGCKSDCKDLTDQTSCIAACDAARAACDETAAFLKEQCKVVCPRGQSVSDGGDDPLP